MDRGRRPPWLLVAAAALLVVGSVLLVCGAIIGFAPVGGLYDSESFHCGSAFFFDNSEGYQGTDGFAACRATADARMPLAVAAVGLGAGLVVAASLLRRRAKVRADEAWSSRT
jgi:hypothetical protein